MDGWMDGWMGKEGKGEGEGDNVEGMPREAGTVCGRKI